MRSPSIVISVNTPDLGGVLHVLGFYECRRDPWHMRTVRGSFITSYDYKSRNGNIKLGFTMIAREIDQSCPGRGSCEREWHSQRSSYTLFAVPSLFEFFTFSYHYHLVYCRSQLYVVLSEESASMSSTWSPMQSAARRRMKPLFLHSCNGS